MTVLALAATLLAFALLGLSTDAHHGRRFGRRQTPERKRRMRLAGWISLAIALVPAVASRGWVFGPVLWLGLLMLSAGVVFLFLNFAPAAREPAGSGRHRRERLSR
ncbi:DUF3325 domain-containing protein [Novosphingobium sp. RD2P27]|uniref:DUF3325 domain-containing protein n=1 Tax=Novosphingobium kalidii TaxID=3230299 RepID=A0ABV2D381_9SPHN